ncbi:glycosyltransferase family 4 protein [Mucilaginibacter sp. UR6-11]|uniref:glycosyltransferase family 4 protein n=1 Tax=Mucilaginibacter sp. UR6-11 TaxID=1435644 RepID=UPI001E3C709D|nr:glycosyltransferase [Mucilaginibacter sp. UR6-11]MCC8427173.1 glycosyltransferase [Mucilaginibacter sp. UR6-11]
MKFVFVSYNYNPEYSSPGTWITRVKAYLGVLTALSKNNNVTRIKQISYEGEHTFNGAHFRFVNYNDARLWFPHKMHRLIGSMKPDVVIVHGLHKPLQTMQLRFYLAGKTKIIVQNHAEKPAKGLKKAAQKLASRYVNAYLFASKAMGLDWVRKGNLASADKIHEVMELSSVFYPIDKRLAQAKTGVTETNAFLWVGRLDQNKDPLTVVNAFLKFAADTPSACLYMLYHTEELLPEITRLINNAPRAAAIKLIGKIPNEDMLYWYNSVDFVLSGSHYEGSGTAVCEALSCGCIPLVTDIFSFRMMTNNGNIGLLYEAGNEAGLLTALHQATGLDKSAEKEKALAYFKSTLSFEAIANRIQDIASSC